MQWMGYGIENWGVAFIVSWADISHLLWAKDGSQLQDPVQPSTKWEQRLTWSKREARDSLLFSAKVRKRGIPQHNLMFIVPCIILIVE